MTAERVVGSVSHDAGRTRGSYEPHYLQFVMR